MGLMLDVFEEEVPHQIGDLVAVLLKCEVSGVEQVNLQILQISLVSLAASLTAQEMIIPTNTAQK